MSTRGEPLIVLDEVEMLIQAGQATDLVRMLALDARDDSVRPREPEIRLQWGSLEEIERGRRRQPR